MGSSKMVSKNREAEKGRTLVELLSETEHAIEEGNTSVPICAVTSDSRQTKPGTLFVAIKGLAADGHRFVADAVRKGCAAVVVEQGSVFTKPAGFGCAVVRTQDSRDALGRIAAAFYGHPARQMKLIGVTGTNGKTTSTYLLEHVIRASGGNPGVIGTVNYRSNDTVVPATHTTPDPVMLQSLLQKMLKSRVTHVVMEASSHAIEQKRLAGVLFDVALFTNLSREHLDYHGDMETYYFSKKKLFLAHLKQGGRAVVMADMKQGGTYSDAGWGKRLIEDLCRSEEWQTANRGRADIIACGPGGDAEVLNSSVTVAGTDAELTGPWGRLRIRSSLIGRYNLDNILGVAGVCTALAMNEERWVSALSGEIIVPGRMQRVVADPGVSVFVDYAHTPDALENVLATLRALNPQRLVVVFGCGGDRDRGKRPVMGEVAGRIADVVVVTSDNPRSEPPERIIGEVEHGLTRLAFPRMRLEALMRRPGMKGYDVVLSRREAIETAIAYAESGDIIAICGKGHEDYQLTSRGRMYFDDRVEAARCNDVVRW